MDIGCYGVYTSRLVFDEEPTRVLGLIGEDPEMRTDVVTSAMLHFRSGQCVFTCGTQLVPYQRVQILGSQGRIRSGDTFKCSAGSAVPYIYRRWSRFLRSQCGDLGIRDLRSIYDPRRPVSQSIRQGTELAVPRELCLEHGGNRSDFPLSQIW